MAIGHKGNSGTVQMTGGSLAAANEYVGESGTGVFTQTDGTNSIFGSLCLGYSAGGEGTYNLNGGTLALQSVNQGSGTAAFSFGGGTLQANGDFATTLPMTLTGNGGNANIDTAGYALTLSGQLSGAGGLNKLGAGTLTLSGINDYAGGTSINQGTLSVSSTAALPGWNVADKYTVAPGAILMVGDAVTNEEVATMLGTGSFRAGSALGFDVATTRVFDGGSVPSTVGLAKRGAGTLTLSHALATTTGPIIVARGTLDLGGFTQETSGDICFLP